MRLTVEHQDRYSRVELLLRTFFGFFYIGIPHFFLLFFVGIWSAILQFISFWIILFTGRYPQSFFEFQVGYMQWSLRLNARLLNLSDEYPAFGIHATDAQTSLEVPYPESLSRGLAIVKFLFGVIYVGIPHGIILFFRFIWGAILSFIAFWVVLFTGEYPESWHKFNVDTLRWSNRVSIYLGYMADDYPPFSGKPL